MALTVAEMREICERVEYKPGYTLLFRHDARSKRYFIQVECERIDTYTGSKGIGWGGKAYLSEHMVASELVRKAFGLFAAYEEHECREWFRYKGIRVFGPHIDIEALVEVGTRVEVRREVMSAVAAGHVHHSGGLKQLEEELERYEGPDGKHRALERVRRGGLCEWDCEEIAKLIITRIDPNGPKGSLLFDAACPHHAQELEAEGVARITTSASAYPPDFVGDVSKLEHEVNDEIARKNALANVQNGESCQMDDCAYVATTAALIVGKQAGWKAVCATHERELETW